MLTPILPYVCRSLRVPSTVHDGQTLNRRIGTGNSNDLADIVGMIHGWELPQHDIADHDIFEALHFMAAGN